MMETEEIEPERSDFEAIPINENLKLSEEQMRMAAERTYLSWIRTGLTSVGIGIAIAKFIIFRNITSQQMGHRLGQLLILWGIGIFVFALLSYRKSYKKLRLYQYEKYPLLPLSIVTALLLFLSVFLFILVTD